MVVVEVSVVVVGGAVVVVTTSTGPAPSVSLWVGGGQTAKTSSSTTARSPLAKNRRIIRREFHSVDDIASPYRTVIS